MRKEWKVVHVLNVKDVICIKLKMKMLLLSVLRGKLNGSGGKEMELMQLKDLMRMN